MICFSGATMISRLFMTRNPLNWNIKDVDHKSLSFRNCNPYSILDLRGVFEFRINHSFESHGFVLYITDSYITVYNSYGGYSKFYTKRFWRVKWVKAFVEFFDSDLEKQKADYHILWGFTRSMVWPVIGDQESPCVFEGIACAQIF